LGRFGDWRLGVKLGFQGAKAEVDEVMERNVETTLQLSAEFVRLL
jgi:hypothetical protein